MGSHVNGSSFPAAGSYEKGDLVRNSDGDLFLCVAAGSAALGGSAQFRKVSGPSAAGSLHILSTPSRIYWTANGDGAFSNGTNRLISAVGSVPTGASAVLVSLLVYGTSSDGYLTAYRQGSSNPGTINAYWGNVPGTQLASTTFIPLSAGREFRLLLSSSGGQAQVAVDLLGYCL